jgi:hypothetical protein
MKVELLEKEVQTYVLSVEIEVEGEKYHADIRYDSWEGHEVNFYEPNGLGLLTEYPEWATKLEEELTVPLGFWLEEHIEGASV